MAVLATNQNATRFDNSEEQQTVGETRLAELLLTRDEMLAQMLSWDESEVITKRCIKEYRIEHNIDLDAELSWEQFRALDDKVSALVTAERLAKGSPYKKWSASLSPEEHDAMLLATTRQLAAATTIRDYDFECCE